MFYVAVFFAVLSGIFCLLYIRERVMAREARIDHNSEMISLEIETAVRCAELEDLADMYWNRSEGYRSNADIFKAERDDALRCLDLVLTEQAARMSRELDNAYDSLSMVLAENEKLRVA